MALSGGVSASTVGTGLDPSAVLLTVQIGTQTFDNIALNWVKWQNGNYGLSGGPIVLTSQDGLSSFTIGGMEFDPDPLLLIAASAINLSGAAVDYSFTFSTPLIPALNGQVNTHSELGVTLTDGLGDGASVAPVAGQTHMLTAFDLYGSGEAISKNVDIGTLSGAGFSSFSADSFFNCVQACVTQRAVLAFSLSSLDSVGFSGRIVQTPVPLPAAAWMFGSGLLGLLGIVRRKRPGAVANA
jgi:hypothetical protein